MRGMGTLINVLGVLGGGSVGLFLRRGISEHLRNQLLRVQGLCVALLGLSGVLTRLGTGEGDALMLLLSMVLGTLVGELIGIEAALEGLGKKLKGRFKASEEGFVQGFLLASMTMCIGAMGILGAFEDALTGGIAILLTKTVLDTFTAFMLAGYYGLGVLFSALPLALWQGTFTLLAGFLAPLITPGVLHHTSLVGSAMILAIGLNLLLDAKLSVANMLPALIFAGVAVLF